MATKTKINYPTSADGYDVYEQIGRGAFAKVYPGTLKGKPTVQVAIKVLDVSTEDPNWESLSDEIATLRELKHENVIDVFTSFSENDTLWIVTPLMGAGSCADIMRRLFKKGFTDEPLLATILQGTLKALAYMHGLSKIHRDVKAGNILISNDGVVKLADFGVSGTMLHGGKMEDCHTFTGSPCWMAPEVMEQSEGYDGKADMWSFGITVMELIFGRAPYANFKPMKIILLTLQEDPPTIDIYESGRKISKDLQKIITGCLKKPPRERLSAKDLLSKSFFKKAKPSSYVIKELTSRLQTECKRDLFATRVDIAKQRVIETKEEDKPVSFRESFVFSASIAELKEIREGRQSIFNPIVEDTDEKKNSQALSVPTPVAKSTVKKISRFEVTTETIPSAGEGAATTVQEVPDQKQEANEEPEQKQATDKDVPKVNVEKISRFEVTTETVPKSNVEKINRFTIITEVTDKKQDT